MGRERERERTEIGNKLGETMFLPDTIFFYDNKDLMGHAGDKRTCRHHLPALVGWLMVWFAQSKEERAPGKKHCSSIRGSSQSKQWQRQ
jgi:hypothetical protein